MESNDLAQKIYFHNLVEQRGGMFPKPFSGKMNSLKIKHLKRIHFFLVSEYGNLTSVKTHCDRLKNLGKETLEQKVYISRFWKGLRTSWRLWMLFSC